MPTIALGEIVDYVSGQYSGPREKSITGVAGLADATSDQLAFLSDQRYRAQLEISKAAAVLVPRDLEEKDARWIRVEHPYFAITQILARWFDERPRPNGISPQSSIASTAKLGRNVGVGPFSVIGENVSIGDDVTIFQNVSIEAGTTIGEKTLIYPNVVIYDGTQIGRRCIFHSGSVVGADGYGFATHQGRHHKILHLGIVRIGDDVEIGASTMIDRAAFGETVIEEGTKIDNLVHVGHNVRIGKHCLIVAQAGISGSTTIGNYVAIGGQVGIAGHRKIGDHARLGSQCGVMHDLPEGSQVFGTPALPFEKFARLQRALKRLIRNKD